MADWLLRLHVMLLWACTKRNVHKLKLSSDINSLAFFKTTLWMWGRKVWLSDENIPVNPLDQVIHGIWHSISEREIGLKMWSPSGLAESFKECWRIESLMFFFKKNCTASLLGLLFLFMSVMLRKTQMLCFCIQDSKNTYRNAAVYTVAVNAMCGVGRCAHTLTVRLLAVMIHSIMADCVPQSVLEKLITCLLISVPCSRQFLPTEQTQDVAIIDTSLLHIKRTDHLFNHHIQSCGCDICTV